MTTLRWGIKRSLLDYVRSMSDGQVVVDDGAIASGNAFDFPHDSADTDNSAERFRGTVTLIGHSGMMRVAIGAPAISPDGERWILSIADPDDPTIRLPFARISAFEGADGSVRKGIGVTLTAEGADLFFGPYVEGTALDPLTLE